MVVDVAAGRFRLLGGPLLMQPVALMRLVVEGPSPKGIEPWTRPVGAPTVSAAQARFAVREGS